MPSRPSTTSRPAPTAPTAGGLPIEFGGDMAAAFKAVRKRLATVIESVCGSEPRAQDVTDKFEVYRKLGWQLWNVAYADDLMGAVKHLPNPKTLDGWTSTAQARGVSPDLIARLNDALAQFNRSASMHADDRETLEMLVESHAPDEESSAKWRKGAFAGNAFTFGVRARRTFATAIVYPSRTKPGHLDLLRVQGLFGLMRTRAGVRWPFAQLLFRDNNAAQKMPGRAPLVESAAVRETGVPLFEQYCSSPLPALRRHPRNETILEDELLPAPVGESGTVDVVTAEVISAALAYEWGAPGQSATYGTGVRTPSELLVSDLLLHRSLYPGAKRDLIVFGELMTPFSRDDRDRVPVAEKVTALGNVADGIATADIPRHEALIKDVFAHAALDPADFDAYRVRMRFPPMPVSVVIRHELTSSTESLT